MPHVGAAQICYVSDDEPGIARRGQRRFRYLDEATGEVLKDPELLARIKALAIPPAWTDVWVCADPDGHLQATGRDARGRKQYRYHPAFREERDRAKFEELVPFGHALGTIRKRVDEDLDLSGLPFERVLAVVVAILDRTYVRIGNESYAQENRTYGLTTLRNRHAKVDGQTLRMRFKGKGGKEHDAVCTDRRLARLVKRCQELPGQVLFQYVDEEGSPRPVRSGDVNDYLRATTGLEESEASAKTFRTWGGTVMAAAGFALLDPPTTVRERQACAKAVVEVVASHLGNTPAVCRASYIHPAIIDGYEDGSLQASWREGPSRAAGGLLADERKVLAILER